MFPIDIRGWVHLAVKLRGYFTYIFSNNKR